MTTNTNFLRVFALLSVVAKTYGQCSVCGEGKEVTAPDVIFASPGQPALPCGSLELFGAQGFVPQDACVILPEIIADTCACAPVGGGDAPTAAPVPDPTSAPVPDPTAAPTSAPVPDPTSAPVPDPTAEPTSAPVPVPATCSVCGEGKKVTDPDAIFSFPGYPSLPCGDLESYGEMGLVPVDNCAQLPEAIAVTCSCAPEVAPVPPTQAPVPPTPAPVTPTPAPVTPTPAPVTPTRAPTLAPVFVLPTDVPTTQPVPPPTPQGGTLAPVRFISPTRAPTNTPAPLTPGSGTLAPVRFINTPSGSEKGGKKRARRD